MFSRLGGFFIPNSVQYTTPSIGGWTASVMTTTKNGARDGSMPAATVDADKYTAYNVSGSLAGASLSAGYQSRTNTYSSWVAGGTYGLGDLTIGANISSHKDEGADAVGAYLVSANYALGNGTSIVGGVARNDRSTEQTLTNIGLRHDLSKRTFVYLTHTRGTNGAISSLSERGRYATTGADNQNTVVVYCNGMV
ncbi:MAG: porin [Betaproteobacteria bacterium]